MSDTLASAPPVVPEPLIHTEGFSLAQSKLNVEDAVVLDHIRSSIRRGHPQMVASNGPRYERVCLVGSGPSLESTLDDLRAAVLEGAKVVAMNGSAEWCMDHHIRPSAHVILDARATNARFVAHAIPRCAYLIASQCHPAVWDALEGRDNVWIFHPVFGQERMKESLDAYYMGRWQPVLGGCTVATRALWLMVLQGYRRFDVYGVDSCWMNGQHHAFDQPENEKDKMYDVTLEPDGRPELRRTFQASLWHLKQFEDWMEMLRHHGSQWSMVVHGDGMLAHALRVSGGNVDSLGVNAEVQGS